MKITVRMCVELDYEIDIDPTEYKDGKEFFESIEEDIEANVEGYVKNINITQPSIEECELPTEIEDVRDFAENIKYFEESLTKEQTELVNKIISHIKDLEDKVRKFANDFVFNDKSTKLIKEIERGDKFMNFYDIFDTVSFKEEETTQEEWNDLEKYFNEWLKKYEELK